MSTTKSCPKCFKDINVNAKRCPECQADLRNWFIRHKFLTALLILLVIIGIGVFSSSGDEKVIVKSVDENGNVIEKEVSIDDAIALRVTADRLCADYESNEVKADAKYKDSKLEITGKVDSISSDFSDNAVVNLKCGGEYSFTSVSCSFSNNSEAAELSKGDNITVIGVSTGEIIGSPTVKNCKIK